MLYAINSVRHFDLKLVKFKFNTFFKLHSFWQLHSTHHCWTWPRSGLTHCAIVTVFLFWHIFSIRTDIPLSCLHLSDLHHSSYRQHICTSLALVWGLVCLRSLNFSLINLQNWSKTGWSSAIRTEVTVHWAGCCPWCWSDTAVGGADSNTATLGCLHPGAALTKALFNTFCKLFADVIDRVISPLSGWISSHSPTHEPCACQPDRQSRHIQS